MIVEIHGDTGKIGEIALSAAGRAIGLNDLARYVMETTKIVAPGPVLVTPEDGERYLRVLPANFAGTRFWAILVE